MEQVQKEQVLECAKVHVSYLRDKVQIEQERNDVLLQELRCLVMGKSIKLDSTDPERLHIAERRAFELEHIVGSPYFIKCRVRFDGESQDTNLYFSKFSFSEEDVYSWTTPAALIRFEPCGRFSYQSHDGSIESGQLLEKEQYLITDGKIVFLAIESLGKPRELVYQEYTSPRCLDRKCG